MSQQDGPEKLLKTPSDEVLGEPVDALVALRRIRLARGLSLEDVSARLKFAARQIEAFEEGRWDDLPSGIGLRALAKNYSRMLGVDMASLETLLPKPEVRGGTLIAMQHASASGMNVTTEPVVHSRSWPWVVSILLVVMVVLGVAIWQDVLPRSMLPGWLKGMFE